MYVHRKTRRDTGIGHVHGGSVEGGQSPRARGCVRRSWRDYNYCIACSLRGEDQEASERRRRRIGELSERVLGPSHVETDNEERTGQRGQPQPPAPVDTRATDVPPLVEELWALSEAESLPLVWHRYAVIAAMKAATELGDTANALRWAVRGAESTRLSLGADAPATTTFEMVVQLWKPGGGI